MTLTAAAMIATAAGAQIHEAGQPAGAVEPQQPIQQPERQPAEEPGPAVEVVFVLDTTGSMSGLIEGAKQKIWSIANAIVTGEPRPQVRMGLVGYRDRTDDYVTRHNSLTDDLDAVYTSLMDFQASGGGDTPESVNQALNEAVTSFAWSQDDDTLRIVYLVGDAPPHMDYEQDVKYEATCEMAAKRGIIVNTIQCGSMAATTPVWQQIARLAEGEYFQIDQSGGMRAITTPHDEELAALARELGDTMLVYGSARRQAEQLRRLERANGVSAAAPAEAAADRAAFLGKAGEGALLGGADLVRAVQEGRVSLDELESEELPEAMREMSSEAQRAYVSERAERRADVRARIDELSAKRDAYIQEELTRLGGADSFDRRVLEALRSQAARVGIRYTVEDE